MTDSEGGGVDEEMRELHVLWRKLPVNCCEMVTQQVYFNPYTARLDLFFIAVRFVLHVKYYNTSMD